MSEFKLPPNVIPKHYNLELDIDLQTLTHRGKESIFLKFDRMKSRRQKDVIKLHSVDLNLTKVALYLNTKSKDGGIDGEYFYLLNRWHHLLYFRLSAPTLHQFQTKFHVFKQCYKSTIHPAHESFLKYGIVRVLNYGDIF